MNNVSQSWRLFRLALLLAAIAALGVPGSAQASTRVVSRTLPKPTVVLDSILIGAVGEQAVFDVFEADWHEITEASGIYQEAYGDTPPGGYLERAVRLRYTVLQPTPKGAPRLLTQAYALDPATGQLQPGLVWETVFVLADGEATRESGAAIPEDYAALVAPGWLIDWPLTHADRLPDRPLSLGSSWQAVLPMPIPDTSNPAHVMPLVGQFVKWIDVEGVGPVAHINEAAQGAAVLSALMFSDLPGTVDFDGEALQDYYLIPDTFPLFAEKFLSVNEVFHVEGDPNSQARLQVVLVRNFVRDVGGQFVWPPTDR